MTGPLPAIIVLTQAGLDVARRVAAALPGAEVHGLAGRAATAEDPVDAGKAYGQMLATCAAWHKIIRGD